MSSILLALGVFWIAVALGAVVTTVVIPVLRKLGAHKRADRKQTLYGEEAVEFKKIREKEEQGVKRRPVPRMGGLTLVPTIAVLGISLAVFLDSRLLLFVILTIVAVVLIMLYDDLTDIGIINRTPLRIRDRLLLLGGVTMVAGFSIAQIVPHYVTFLPFAPFENVFVGTVGIALLFALWCIFWQVSSVIDGIDGLAGSIFLILFSGTSLLSIMQGNESTLLLSALGLGVVIPWLFANYAPAKAYLTETGITTLITLFATITFLLGVGTASGAGLWVGAVFGTVLIATWASNVLQLVYRRKTGKKLFRIAPLHHHFEAIGMPGSAVVLRYTLVTFLCVVLGLSLMHIL